MLKRIKQGDEVYIVASSSFIDNESQHNAGLEILKKWGLRIKQNDIIARRYSSYAGNDEIRFKEIQEAQNSKLVFFAKGGWGSARVLEKNPLWNDGWMVGFSDPCSLLLSKYAHGCSGSVHGPMISTLSSEPSWSIDRLKNLLFEGHVECIQGNPLKEGIAEGQIIVTNLTIASFLIGTNHLPDLTGKIIVFEDINEDIYKIDRMLTYFRVTKKLEGVAGIGFGNFFDSNENISKKELFRNLILDRLEGFNIPVVIDLPIGHTSGNACIPLGFNSVLNGNNGSLDVQSFIY